MTEKKSLDFNFLDESPKKADGTVGAVAAALPIPEEAGEKINFFEYFKQCYSNFNGFAKKYLTRKNAMYLIPAIWVMGVGNAADRITSSNSSTWGEVWAIALIGGIFTGALTYFIAGWFYHVRVEWSKGKSNIDTSRNIYVFTSLPVAITSIGALLFNHIAYGGDYFDTYYSDASNVDLIFAVLALAAIVYSIYLSYRAVRDVLHADKGRAIGWFIVAPAIFYVAVFSAALL